MTKEETIKFVKSLYPDLKDADLEKFLHVIKSTGLDPVRNQIYVVSRNTKDEKGNWKKNYTIQTSIDGFRLIAERTEKYAPGKEPKWNYNKNGDLESATAYVKKMTKDGTWHEIGATAYLQEYIQRKKNGDPTKFWSQMPKLMLSKCAESLALRKAFPESFSSVYSEDEMEQAENGVQNEGQNDNQNERKKKEKRTEEEVGILLEMFEKVPAYRKEIEKFLLQKEIFNYEDMPKRTYQTILNNAKRKIKEKNNGKK